jgi:hypothetical protein
MNRLWVTLRGARLIPPVETEAGCGVVYGDGSLGVCYAGG